MEESRRQHERAYIRQSQEIEALRRDKESIERQVHITHSLLLSLLIFPSTYDSIVFVHWFRSLINVVSLSI